MNNSDHSNNLTPNPGSPENVKRYITKIKTSGGVRLQSIEYNEVNEATGETKEIKLSSKEQPYDSFFDAMSRLKMVIIDICQLPQDIKFLDRIIPTGLSLTQEDGVMGVVITGQVKTDHADAPVIINTPYLTDNPDNNHCLDAGNYAAVMRIVGEASKYIRGYRKVDQSDMFDDVHKMMSTGELAITIVEPGGDAT